MLNFFTHDSLATKVFYFVQILAFNLVQHLIFFATEQFVIAEFKICFFNIWQSFFFTQRIVFTGFFGSFKVYFILYFLPC